MKAQDKAILIAADSIELLRKIDVFRVLDSCPAFRATTPRDVPRRWPCTSSNSVPNCVRK
jgi:hypothetical protein